jgi:methylglutaconyl-CoA hydratase
MTDAKTAGTVAVEIHDSIGFVRFEHPKSNSLPGAMLRSMADEINKLAQNSSVKAIVLRSGGSGAFCAGASFDELAAVNDATAGKEFFSGFARVILAMTRAPQFVLTRVHGKVTGGGVGLIAASDYSVAVEGASLKLSELAVGIGPFVIGPVVERRLGTGPFTDLAIDADWRDAQWGERHGLYSHVYPDVKAMDTALAKLMDFLASANPEAIRQMKKVFWADTEHWEELLEKRAAISGALAMSVHTRAAIEKFQQR